MMHRLSLMNTSLFTTSNESNLARSSLLLKNVVYFCNSSLSYAWWLFSCLFPLEHFIYRWSVEKCFSERLPEGKQLHEVPFLIAKLQAVVLPVYGWWGV